jgi:integrase/recombinase XerD
LPLRNHEREEEMGKPKTRVSEVRVSGPLVPFVEGFKACLKEAGYTPLSAAVQVRLLAHLSRWLEAGQLRAADLGNVHVEEYLRFRRAAGYTGLVSNRGLEPLLGFLASEGALPAPEPLPACSNLDALLASFQRYLLTERGLTPSTARAHLRSADRFLQARAGDGDLATLSAADVSSAVLAEASRLSVRSTQYFAGGLRSFLRFCLIEGLIDVDLSAAALYATGCRRSSLPRGISQGDAKALLASCDRRRALGRRDYAVVLVLLRLGLRASEVAHLMLEDIDWRAGELVVHGKGRRDEALPLPADVGEALANYLKRGRPKTPQREVFLTGTAPVGPLTREAVSCIVRRACQRADIASVGAHCLRHTAACDMVRAGAPLAEIGQVLRHRSLASTAIYARVDLDSLRSIAQQWPEGDSR